MRTVLHIFSGDLWAGAEVMICTLLCQLAREPDYEVLALALNEGVLVDRLRAAGVKTTVIPESGAHFLSLLGKVRKEFGCRKIDIVHTHRDKENLLGVLLARDCGAKVLIATLHGLPEPPGKKRRRYGRVELVKLLRFVLLRWCFKRLVAVSGEMRQVLLTKFKFPADLITVIHNGINVDGRAHLARESGIDPVRRSVHIGTVGRLVPVKDFGLFLQVAALLRASPLPLRFSILGDGPQRDELTELRRALGLEGVVEFVAPRKDPMPFYESLDIYLCTSQHEGLPMSILEAMSCRLPVVAPFVGGIPEVISHGINGLLVRGRTPERFADDCLALVNDPDFMKRLGDQAAATVSERFSAEAMTKSYKHLYAQCLGALW